MIAIGICGGAPRVCDWVSIAENITAYIAMRKTPIGTTTARKNPSESFTQPFHCSVNIFQPSPIQSPKRTSIFKALSIVQEFDLSSIGAIRIIESEHIAISDGRRRDHPRKRDEYPNSAADESARGDRGKHESYYPPHECIA